MQMMITTERGCGTRVEEGVYFECGMSPDGDPVESFLICPPRPVSQIKNFERLGVTARGVTLVDFECEKCNGTGVDERGMNSNIITAIADHILKKIHGVKEDACLYCAGKGVVAHVLDVVGKNFYKHPTDCIEEIRVLGLSRRGELEANDYARLSYGSTILLLHPEAYIVNFEQLYKAERTAWNAGHWFWPNALACPQAKFDHSDHLMGEKNTNNPLPNEMCTRLLYQNLTGVSVEPPHANEMIKEESPRLIERKLPCGYKYLGLAAPNGFKPKYELAAFARFPIHNLAVVRSKDGGHKKKIKKAANAFIPVKEVDY